jgi:hypothetical protein
MQFAALIGGVLCLGTVLLDAFQTIILPRRPRGRFRVTRFFYLLTWMPWVAVTRRIPSRRARETMYSIYGPLSLILLLVLWAVMLVSGFALLYYSMGSPFVDQMGSGFSRLRTDLYVSGTTLFTLGLGDVLPRSLHARELLVLESGMGLGFVALVIGYLPVFYGAFSRREVNIALLDARAGSPPTATELLRRHSFEGGAEALGKLFEEWERWAAELLESHLSYPNLCYYRSQHDNQSWLSALTAILDTCSLQISSIRGPAARQAQLTFAIARHALVDLSQVFSQKPCKPLEERLPTEVFQSMCSQLSTAGVNLCGDAASSVRLEELRGLYEPYAWALGQHLRMDLPPWVPAPRAKDSWQTVARLHSQAQNVPPGVLEIQDIQVSDQAVSTRLHDEEHHHF